MFTLDITHQKVHEGASFVINKLFTDVVNGDSVYVRFKAIDQSMNIVFKVEVEGKAFFKTYEGTTYTDDGTVVTPFNRIVGDGKVVDAEIYHTPTINVLGTQRGNRLIPAGKSGTATGGQSASRLESVILPGQELLLEVENASGQVRDIDIVADWYQVDRGELNA